MERPKPIYVAHHEGGDLVPFEGLMSRVSGKGLSMESWNDNFRAHVIYFEDGSQFDMINGWRKTVNRPIIRVPMGRA